MEKPIGAAVRWRWSQGKTVAPVRATAPLIALFLLLIPLAFSDDFVEALSESLGRDPESDWLLVLAVDALLLNILAILTVRLAAAGDGPRSIRLWLWWLAGAAATIVMDILLGTKLSPGDRDAGFAEYALYALVYLLALACLLAAMLGASPLAVVWKRAREAHGEAAWSRLIAALPLFIGTAAAYVASLVWNLVLNNSAARSFAEAGQIISRQVGAPQEQTRNESNADVFALLNGICGGAVDQEYFAQISQLIPLLLIAVGLEAGFFDRFRQASVDRAAIIATVLILFVGEVMSLSALPLSNQGCLGTMSPWHEYTAFILTAEACFVAIATLIWALIPRSEAARNGASPPRTGRIRG